MPARRAGTTHHHRRDRSAARSRRVRPVTRFHLTYADRPVGRLAILTMDNGEDHTKPNTFGAEALRRCPPPSTSSRPPTTSPGLLLTGKPFIFAVGADLKSFTGMDADTAPRRPASSATTCSPGCRRCRSRPWRRSTAPAWAAGSRSRCTATPDPVDRRAGVAFPEVFLSILPAWGGTQLAPRIVGAKDAIETIVINPLNNNKTMKPEGGLRARLRRPVLRLGHLPRRLGRVPRAADQRRGDHRPLRTRPDRRASRRRANALGMIEGKTAARPRRPYGRSS
jgi:hypothetical protein